MALLRAFAIFFGISLLVGCPPDYDHNLDVHPHLCDHVKLHCVETSWDENNNVSIDHIISCFKPEFDGTVLFTREDTQKTIEKLDFYKEQVDFCVKEYDCKLP